MNFDGHADSNVSCGSWLDQAVVVLWRVQTLNWANLTFCSGKYFNAVSWIVMKDLRRSKWRIILHLENKAHLSRDLMYFRYTTPLATAVKPAATPKCMVNLADALFCCACIYSALRRSSAGLSPAFTKPFFLRIHTNKNREIRVRVIYIKKINYTN